MSPPASPYTEVMAHPLPCRWVPPPSALSAAAPEPWALPPPRHPRRAAWPFPSASTTWPPATSTSPTTSYAAMSTGTRPTSWPTKAKVGAGSRRGVWQTSSSGFNSSFFTLATQQCKIYRASLATTFSGTKGRQYTKPALEFRYMWVVCVLKTNSW